MAFTYGFYNSSNGDRTYDAIDISRIFDGVVTDGVFAGIGDLFAVTPGSGLQIGIGTGKAWFNHTWNRNDNVYLMAVGDADITLSRIDLVYLKVDSRDSVRANSLEIRKGEPAVEPQKPQLVQNPDDGIYEHALAYVTIRPASTQIEARDIEIVVGTEETPFVTSILQQTNIDSLWENWKTQFGEFLVDSDSEMNEWMANTRSEFDEWWAAIKATLDTETATRLQNQINELKTGKVDVSTYNAHVALKNAHEVGFGNLKHVNINNVRTVNCNNFASELEPICLVASSSANSPGSGASYWIIQTIQYNAQTCTQIAYPYATITVPIRFRNCYNGSWTQWTDVVTTSKIQEILRSPGVSNRIGDIHTTMRTDMGSNWLKCTGIPISETSYPNAQSIIDPNMSRWPYGTGIKIAASDRFLVGGVTSGYGSGVYALVTSISAGSATIKYGPSPKAITNTYSLTIPSSGTLIFFGYSKIIGWVAAYKVGTTFYLLKSSSVTGPWTSISGSANISNDPCICKVFDNGVTVLFGIGDGAWYYCDDGNSLKSLDLAYGYVYDIGYANGKYYFSHMNRREDSEPVIRYNTVLNAIPTSKCGGVAASSSTKSGLFKTVGSDIVFIHNGAVHTISRTTIYKPSINLPFNLDLYAGILPMVIKNKKCLLFTRFDRNNVNTALFAYNSATNITILSKGRNETFFTSSSAELSLTLNQLSDDAYTNGYEVKAIEPYTPIIDSSPATSYILAKELI